MIKFKFNNCLLISLLLISVSNAFQITSDAYINYAGGYFKVKFYYDANEKLMGYKFTEPINMEVLYDYKNHVEYKRGNYVDNSDYYIDYFDSNITKKALNIKKNNIINNSNNTKDFYKYEKRYYYDDFPILDSVKYTAGDSKNIEEVIDANPAKILRPYYIDIAGKNILVYTTDTTKNIDYMYYTHNYKLLEFKLLNRDLTFVLIDAKETEIDVKEEFGVYSSEFSTMVTKSNSIIDIVFLLDESENIAEQEFNKIINFCKLNVIQYSLDYNKARFAIVGYGSYGVLHLNFTNSIYDIITTLDKLKTQQIRGKTCLGCGLSIASDVFDHGRSDVQQMLINVMASGVNQPTYSECEKENQTTYYDYCIENCNKLEYDICSDPIGKDVKIKYKVLNFDEKRDEIDCQCKNYNNNGYHCSDCSCDESKKHIVCKECTLEAKYGYKRCNNKIQKLGCKIDNTITFIENYTESVRNILSDTGRIIVNIGIGEETKTQIKALSTKRRNQNIETDYLFSSFDQFNDVSSISNFTSHISELLYDKFNNECGIHCNGLCGLNGQCYCPTECYVNNEESTYTVCITDDKNLTVSGCEKVPKICSPPLTEDGIPNMCYTASYDSNDKKCVYTLNVIEEPTDPCKVSICDPRDGSIKEFDDPASCSIPENRYDEEIKIGDDTIIVDVTFKLINNCTSDNEKLKCYIATYDTICTSKSDMYKCYGLDGECYCVLTNKGKDCKDDFDTTRGIYKHAIINGNKCTYETYKLESTENICEYKYSKSTDSEKKTINDISKCIAPKPRYSYGIDINSDNSEHIGVLYEYEIESGNECKNNVDTCQTATYTTKCKSLDPRYVCNYKADDEIKCQCIKKTSVDCTDSLVFNKDYNYCYKKALFGVNVEGRCLYYFEKPELENEKYLVCDKNQIEYMVEMILNSNSYNIFSINASNTINLGKIYDYTFDGYLYEIEKQDQGTRIKRDETKEQQIQKSFISVFKGYKKVGVIVYDEDNQPTLSLETINIPLAQNKMACSDNKCIEFDDIPKNTKQYEFYTIATDDNHPVEILEPSNKYYDGMSGISISKIQPFNHPYEGFKNHQNCISGDKCYIGFETYDGKCLQSKLILPDTNDTECFEYVCDDGKLIQKPLYHQFTLINSPCVKKYGDKLNMFNGRVWYHHLIRYVSRLIDVLFVITVIIIVIISFVIGIVVNFIKIKKIKSYIQLDSNEDIELEDTDNTVKTGN